MAEKIEIPKEIFTLPEGRIVCNYRLGNSKTLISCIVFVGDSVCEKYDYHSGDVLENEKERIIIIGVGPDPLSFYTQESVLFFYNPIEKRVRYHPKWKNMEFEEAGYKIVGHIELICRKSEI